MPSTTKFPRAAVAATAFLLLGAGSLFASPRAAAERIPDAHRIGGFAIGCQAYSFNRFTAFEAIEKTAQAGGKVIEFYPGQRLSADTGDVRLDQNLSDENIAKLKAKLDRHGVRAVNFGVVGLGTDEAANRKVFEFARKMGIPTVTSEPDARAFDLLERLVKEYDIRLAIHNHPRNPNDPNYRYWDPNYVLSLVRNRDRRIGACADTGHWVRSGVRPVDALRILRGRVLSSHLKDLHVAGPGGHDVPFGNGVSDIKGILDELRRQNFDGNISVEYEYNWENSVPDIAQCIGFVRGYAAALPPPNRVR
jgi:sugar phosphate isomerase/epimerase